MQCISLPQAKAKQRARPLRCEWDPSADKLACDIPASRAPLAENAPFIPLPDRRSQEHEGESRESTIEPERQVRFGPAARLGVHLLIDALRPDSRIIYVFIHAHVINSTPYSFHAPTRRTVSTPPARRAPVSPRRRPQSDTERPSPSPSVQHTQKKTGDSSAEEAPGEAGSSGSLDPRRVWRVPRHRAPTLAKTMRGTDSACWIALRRT